MGLPKNDSSKEDTFVGRFLKIICLLDDLSDSGTLLMDGERMNSGQIVEQ